MNFDPDGGEFVTNDDLLAALGPTRDDLLSDGYGVGYDEGVQDGYDDGYAEGRTAGVREGADRSRRRLRLRPRRRRRSAPPAEFGLMLQAQESRLREDARMREELAALRHEVRAMTPVSARAPSPPRAAPHREPMPELVYALLFALAVGGAVYLASRQ